MIAMPLGPEGLKYDRRRRWVDRRIRRRCHCLSLQVPVDELRWYFSAVDADESRAWDLMTVSIMTVIHDCVSLLRCSAALPGHSREAAIVRLALRTHGCLAPVDVGFGHGAPPSCRVCLDRCVSAGDRSQQYSDCCSRLDETASPEMRMI